MPNYCETDFTIEGPTAQVDEVLAKYFTADGGLDCDKVIPYPQVFKDLDAAAKQWESENCVEGKKYVYKEGVDFRTRPKDGFNSGGYEWCIENWGTKWGTFDGKGVEVQSEDQGTKKVFLSFQSAWSPASPVFAELADKYPDLWFTATSYERGVGYEYYEEYHGGQLVMHEEKSYSGERGG